MWIWDSNLSTILAWDTWIKLFLTGSAKMIISIKTVFSIQNASEWKHVFQIYTLLMYSIAASTFSERRQVEVLIE